MTDYILRQRPDTKWKPYLVTNVRFVMYHLNYPLGNAVHLPEQKQFYKDQLCAFRCLAVHQGHLKDQLESHTKALFDRWVQFASEVQLDVDSTKYQGLSIHQMAYFERCFEINVNVYHLRDDGVALTVYKSICHYKDAMHVNQFDHHLSYISNLSAYIQKYQCGTCDRHLKHVNSMKRYQRKCTG